MVNTKILLFCLIIGFQPFANGFDSMSIMDIKDILRFGRETIVDILESWSLIQPKKPGEEENTFPFVYRMEKELRNRISLVSSKIDVFQRKMAMHIDLIVTKLLADLPLQESLDHKLSQIDQYVGQINDLYDNFEVFAVSSTTYGRFTLEDFATTCVSSRSGALPDILKSIHRLLVPSSDQTLSRSILVLLAKQMDVF